MITYTELDKMGCGNPDCKEDHSVIFLHCKANWEHRVEIAYHKEHKTLTVACMECEKRLVTIFIAPGVDFSKV
jgi:hypothetical protein